MCILISSRSPLHNQDGYYVTYPFDTTCPAAGVQVCGTVCKVCDGYRRVTGLAPRQEFGAADVGPGWVEVVLAVGEGWGWLSVDGGEEGEEEDGEGKGVGSGHFLGG